MEGKTWPTMSWPEATPEAQGMASARLAQLVASGGGAGWDSLLLVRHGAIVTEAYYAPFAAGTRHALNSATKGVVGTLVGIAARRGLLDSVDHPVLDFFGDRTIAHGDARKQAMTVRHLLDMTSGLKWTEPLTGIPATATEMSRSPDRVQFVLDRPMADPPGTVFNYNSGNAHLLSAILTRLTGRCAADFARDQLFGPLGITDVVWEADPQGNSLGGRGLQLQPRDMAKLGYLYLENGAWHGTQLLPETWAGEIRRGSVKMQMPGRIEWCYARQFWTVPQREAFMAVGFNSQIIMVLPRLDLVAVVTGRQPPQFSALFTALAEAVQSDQPLAADPAGMAALEAAVTNAARAAS